MNFILFICLFFATFEKKATLNYSYGHTRLMFESLKVILAAKYIPLRIAFDHKTKRLHPELT